MWNQAKFSRAIRTTFVVATATALLLVLMAMLGAVPRLLLAAEPDGVLPTHAIVLTKTVGTDPHICANESITTVIEGTTVYYCYRVTNTGSAMLDQHYLFDSELGMLVHNRISPLNPGASFLVTATLRPDVSVTNVATWTAIALPQGFSVQTLDIATATATVNVIPPVSALQVVKSVGLSPSECATDSSLLVEPGTTVYYCFAATNTGKTNLLVHSVVDSVLGPLLTDFQQTLTPGETVFVTRSHTANVSATNIVTWTSLTSREETLSATATATVEVGVPAITLQKVVASTDTCSGSANLMVKSDDPVWYCLRLTNTGDFTFTQHAISDPLLGIFQTVNLELVPGASAIVSNDLIAALAEVFVTESVTNTAIVTSSNPGGSPPVTASSTSVARVTILVPTSDTPEAEPVIRRTYLPLLNR
jgi:hypothetical protein